MIDMRAMRAYRQNRVRPAAQAAGRRSSAALRSGEYPLRHRRRQHAGLQDAFCGRAVLLNRRGRSGGPVRHPGVCPRGERARDDRRAAPAGELLHNLRRRQRRCACRSMGRRTRGPAGGAWRRQSTAGSRPSRAGADASVGRPRNRGDRRPGGNGTRPFDKIEGRNRLHVDLDRRVRSGRGVYPRGAQAGRHRERALGADGPRQHRRGRGVARMPPSDLGRADQSLAQGSLRPHGAGRRVRLLHRLLPHLILRARLAEFYEPGWPSENQRKLYGLAYEEVHHNMSLIKPGVGFQEYA